MGQVEESTMTIMKGTYASVITNWMRSFLHCIAVAVRAITRICLCWVLLAHDKWAPTLRGNRTGIDLHGIHFMCRADPVLSQADAGREDGNESNKTTQRGKVKWSLQIGIYSASSLHTCNYTQMRSGGTPAGFLFHKKISQVHFLHRRNQEAVSLPLPPPFKDNLLMRHETAIQGWLSPTDLKFLFIG